MDCTRQTRVEGVNGAQEFKWTIWIHNGRLKERSLIGPTLAVCVSWTRIPRRRHDRPVVFDCTVFDLHSVPQLEPSPCIIGSHLTL